MPPKKPSVGADACGVKFLTTPGLADVLDPPVPAIKALPSFYKALPSQLSESVQDSSAKRCMPFLDAISSGFIIPLWADMFVKVTETQLHIEFPENLPFSSSIEHHSYEQLENYPLADLLPHGKKFMKFINPWLVSTAPGVSCLFTSPLNHFEHRIKIIDGVVDTDTYYNYVNFPFVWTGAPGEYLIKRGTPLVQVIPFVRAPNLDKMSVSVVDEEKVASVSGKLGTALFNKYRQFFWHKRKTHKEEQDKLAAYPATFTSSR